MRGVGYFINISLNTYAAIPDEEHLRIYTHLQVREDAHTLFGFYTLAEREIFRLLISVSGVGSSTARTMLSSMTPAQVRDAIASEDVPAIKAVKGIGAKTAQRVILDLRDKVLKLYDLDEVSPRPNNTNKEEALSALVALGFPKKTVDKAVTRILSEQPELSVEEVVKAALKFM